MITDLPKSVKSIIHKIESLNSRMEVRVICIDDIISFSWRKKFGSPKYGHYFLYNSEVYTIQKAAKEMYKEIIDKNIPPTYFENERRIVKDFNSTVTTL
jgi:hypothetical protein